MFVWERAGRVWIKDPGETSFTQLLNISEEVANWGDHGCLGFTLDPEYNVNGRIYLFYAVDRHYLLNFGTPNYNANSNLNTAPLIGRVTRYTCTSASNFRSVDLASRFILIGDSKTNGFPILSDTHAVGSLVFGQDGTLLVSFGDGASAWLVDTGGDVSGSFASQALADGIIRPKENVGAYRAQLVDSLGGKIVRIDPNTGDGVPSNPYYDASKPRSAKSRVWALGQRNPFRMSLRPDSGSHDPADGRPGVLYIGNVGWDNWEALKVVTGPAQNMGWPLFEGLEITPDFVLGGTYNVDVYNQDATNALCGGYFSFRQLLKQDTTNVANMPPFNNPCNASVKISTNIPQFLHRRPVLDWNHASAITRTPTYDGTGAAVASSIGTVGSGVSGAQFQGTCASAGVWYTASNATAFPTQYLNTYFMADWTQGFIKNVSFTTNDKPVSVSDFASGGGAIVSLVQHPLDGSLYYVTYNYGDAGTVRQLSFTGNRTPVPVLTADQTYGPGPLTVQFNGSGSSDPDGQSISFLWNFGDGTPTSSQPNPAHVFTAPGASQTNYTVTLTVTDSAGLPASTSINIALNDTPPNVAITAPTNGALFSIVSNTPFNLAATVSDAESSDSLLKYSWVTLLRHNDHSHVVGTSTNHVGVSTTVEPIGCDGVNIYYYTVMLTVTDPYGLATTKSVDLFPNCGITDTPPTISNIADQSTTLNVPTAAIPFTIGDAQVAAANLQLRGGSSNPALVPTNNIVFGGGTANRTVTVTPANNMNGTAIITVYVNDGPNNSTDTFVLTVTGTNTPPTISGLVNQTVGEGTPTPTNVFAINDANTLPGNLLLSGFAANPTLVPSENIAFGGAGSNRTVVVTPAAGQSGTTTVTVVVSDGQLSASNSYALTVTSLPAGTSTLTNTTAIAVLDNSPAAPYPSTINISGLGGVVTNVTATLRTVSHGWAKDLDVLLVSPGGKKVVLMSDTGTNAISSANFTFSSAAAGFLPANSTLTSGTYKPTDYAPTDVFPSPAPAGPYETNLTAFNGGIANGPWQLYVYDDGPGDTGRVAGGWTITVSTASTGTQPPTITAIADQTTITNTPVGPLAFTIADADTAIGSLTLSNASSNPSLLPTNNIVFGGGGASRTVTVTPASGQTGTANVSIFVSDGTNIASSTFLLTVVSAQPQTLSFTNAAGIGIRDTNSALPYPATINVSGMQGTVSNVTVTLRGFTQTWASDVDVLLVGPGGQKIILMSDVCAGPVNNVTVTLSDSAASAMSAAGGSLVTGTYRPTNLTDTSALGDNFPAPAPAGPYATQLATFNGTNPNGTWSLYVFDDGPGDTGVITNGWSLTISTQPGAASNNPPTITTISNQVTVVNTATAALPFTIGDAETAASNLVLSVFTSNAGLVPTNRIVLGGSGASRTVTVTPTSNQLGSATLSLNVSDGSLVASNSFVLTVNPAPLTVTENSSTRSYGATNPVLTGSISGLQAGDNVTATFATTAATNSPVGSYPITFTLSDPAGKLGNYVVTTNNGTVTVTNAPLTVTENGFSRGYGQTNPVLTGAIVGLQAGDNITASFSTTANTNSPVGVYAIAFTLNDPNTRLGNYLVTTNNGTVTVTNALLTVTALSSNKVYGGTRTFSGTEFLITSGTLFNGNTLTNATLASTGATAGAAVGSYIITITNAVGLGLTNYAIGYTNGTLTVTPAALAITANSSNKVYGATRAFAGTEFAITSGSLFNGNTLTGATLASTGANAVAPMGNYLITITNATGAGLSNYAIAYNTGSLTVGTAGLAITAGSTNKIYGTTLNPTAFSAAGLVNGDTVSSVTLASAGSVNTAPAGSYPITVTNALGTGLTNYAITYTGGSLSVGAATLQITAGNTNKVYGTTLNPAAFSTTGLLNSDNVSSVTLTSGGSAGSAPIGSYAITASGAVGSGLTNYTIGYNSGMLTVGTANLSITAGNTNKVYGTTLNPTAFSAAGLLNSDNVTSVTLGSAGSPGTAPVGNYAITANGAVGSGLTNYTIGYNSGTLTVVAANLSITADSTNKVYGATLNPTAFSTTGLLNSDSVTNVTLTSAGSVSNAPTGSYDIVPSDVAGTGLTNYAVGYNNGTLTVGAATLLVTAGSTNKVYGTTLNATDYSAAGLLNGDSITNVMLTSAGCESTAPVALYAIHAAEAKGSGLTNYTVGYSNGTLAVNAANLVITALNTNKAYGVTLTFDGTEFMVTGLTNADAVSSVSFTSDGASAGAAPGDYPISISNAQGIGLTNYSITYVDGQLNITGPLPPFTIDSVVVSDGVATITWGSISNVAYRLQYTEDPTGTNWTEVLPEIIAPGASSTATNTVGGAIQRFYRIRRP